MILISIEYLSLVVHGSRLGYFYPCTSYFYVDFGNRNPSTADFDFGAGYILPSTADFYFSCHNTSLLILEPNIAVGAIADQWSSIADKNNSSASRRHSNIATADKCIGTDNVGV